MQDEIWLYDSGSASAALIFWAMYRSTSMMERLRPLTPEQRRRKRRVYAVMIPLMATSVALGAALATAGVFVIVAVFAAFLVLDGLLTPWLRYRRAKRRAGSGPWEGRAKRLAKLGVRPAWAQLPGGG